MRLGIYMGRFSPLHLAHEFVINKMIEKYGYDCSQIILGSCNNPQEERHLFTYSDRRNLIKQVYPLMDIVSLADHESDKEWLVMLKDIVILMGCKKHEVEFFAGCEQDVYKLIEAGYHCIIINRFDGTTPVISATQVREALINNKSLDGLVNPKLYGLIRSKFEVRWKEYQDKLNEVVNQLRTFKN